MSTHTHLNLQSQPFFSPAIANWYAVGTLSRHERVVAQQLDNQGLLTFFPTFMEIHRWSDRRKKIELPLFPGYLFVNTNMSSQVRRAIVFARGVAGLITMGGEPIPIPNQQIESVQKLLANNIRCAAHPFLKIGQRVRVRSGALDGIQGIFIAHNGTKGLVISIDGIERSLAVRIEGYDIEVC